MGGGCRESRVTTVALRSQEKHFRAYFASHKKSLLNKRRPGQPNGLLPTCENDCADPGSQDQSSASTLTRGGGHVRGPCTETSGQLPALSIPGDHSALNPQFPTHPPATPNPAPDKGACSSHGDFAQAGPPCRASQSGPCLTMPPPRSPFPEPCTSQEGPEALWDRWTWSHA